MNDLTTLYYFIAKVFKARHIMQNKKYSESKTDQVKEDCENSVLSQDKKMSIYNG